MDDAVSGVGNRIGNMGDNRIETITKYNVKKLDAPVRFSGVVNCSKKDFDDYEKKKALDLFKD